MSKTNTSPIKFTTSGPPPFSSVGLFTYLRTYARRHNDADPESTIESWAECLNRVVLATNNQLNVGFTDDEQQELFDLLYNLKCSVAGRFLWQLGTKTVDKMGLMSLQNCAAVVVDKPVEPFIWVMNFLMLGAGCGYRILPSDLEKTPIVKHAQITRKETNDADFIVPDSREGWTKLLARVLKAHFYSGKGFTYSCVLLRSKGAPIKSFGGTASGPEVLCDGMTKISEILNKRVGQKMRPIDALDVMNIIGKIVVSGNVRRCLPGYMRVHTKRGLVDIKNIEVGDKVLTSDGYYNVTNKFKQGKQPLAQINTEDGSWFHCTLNHKMAVYVNGKTTYDWIEAGDICKNVDALVSKDGLKPIMVTDMYGLPEIEETWDIEVDDKHEFFCSGGDKDGNASFLTHNSAQIALGDCNDTEYMRAKRWDLGTIPNYRCYSNNSVICNDIEDILANDEFWMGYNGSGEPYGLINMKLSRSCGRLGETQYPDPDAVAYNPCLRAGTKIITKNGIVPIETLQDTEFETKNLYGQWSKSKCWLGGRNKQLYKITLDTGLEYYATPDHEWPVRVNRVLKKTTSNNLRAGYKLPFCSNSMPDFCSGIGTYDDGYKIGIESNVFPESVWTSSTEFRHGFIEAIKKKHGFDRLNNGGYCGYNPISDKTYAINLQKFWGFHGVKYTIVEKSYGFILQMPLEGENYDFDTVTITNVELSDIYEDVWDITVHDDTHCFQLAGCITGNCAEQTLCDAETCCLAELYLPNITSREQLYKCAQYLYRICKHSLALPCPDSKKTENIVHSNYRMGIGVTGFLQATEEQKGWLSGCYENLREFDKEYSKKHGFPTSIKITTVKPSGCSRGDMLINTTKGLMRLDELGDVDGDEWQKVEDVQVYTDEEKTEYVTKFYVNGKVPTRLIITKDGMELESSLNHKYRVLTEAKEYIWKTVEELEVGDFLVTRLGNHPTDIVTPMKSIPENQTTNTQQIKQPPILTKELAWFIGLFYGDGSVHKKGIRISFNRKQPGLIKWLIKFFKDTFNLRTTIDDDHSFYINSQQLLRWLEINECLKDYSYSLVLPKCIRTASKENAISFIDGLWRADGGIHNNSNNWSVCTVSETFAKELLCLCRSIGYNVRISCAGPGGLGSRDRWIIQYRRFDADKMRYIAKDLRTRIWGNYWLDPIVSLVESECNTYDIEVENAHHYRIGSTISHNTLSLLAGVTSGVHPGYAQYYIRRIRVASDSPLIKVIKEHGYDIEYVRNFDGTNDPQTMVISFPYSLPKGTVFANDCTAIQQLECVKWMQTNWSDNSVSCTVTYKKEELPSIKAWLKENYNNGIKTVSFLLYFGHGFEQAPLEAITKEKFDEMSAKTRPIIDMTGICFSKSDQAYIGEQECIGNSCPIK